MAGRRRRYSCAAEQGTVKTLLVFGADLVPACGQERLDKVAQRITVVVFDTDYSEQTEYADVILPIGTAPETDGTYTNHAGRVQRARQAFQPPAEAKAGWEVLSSLRGKLGGTELISITEVFSEVTGERSRVRRPDLRKSRFARGDARVGWGKA